ncbi:UDP-glucose dehydrogenase family protein [Virgibacillus byunsanensis]|uniref:UDP-glucose 6-dehydrogenase n=1 Tax=Virgibacillus byunsanensis TaxID=570945 RepID=A0ABW3LP30_9BACI
MKVAILGTGYVGLSTGVCLSDIGHDVICVDLNEAKINKLSQGISPIYEPGMQRLLTKNIDAGRLSFTTSHQEGLDHAEVVIIAVGTPQKDDGGVDLSYIEQAGKDIAVHVKQSTIVVIKSTVPVGTNEYVKRIIDEQFDGNHSIELVSNPEFLRQGSAIMDTIEADRIIIGAEKKEVAMKLQEMYRPLHVPIILTSIRSAEMIKYASNAFLATKISFINEIANLCESVGADVEDVVKGMGKDKRIGNSFLQPGIGYGGSCFPKDVKALLHTAELNGFDFSMLKETIAINDSQRRLLVAKAVNRFGNLKGRKIAMLGLSFKPETDDMREAPSITIARSLIEHGAKVTAYDPVATDNAKKIVEMDKVRFTSTISKAVKEADAIFIVTEWNEFRQMDISEIIKKMKSPIIFDGRNCLENNRIKECKTIEYYPIGRPPIIIGKN